MIKWSQVRNVWFRNFLLFKRSWSVSVFWILIEPVVILGSIGYGVGSYINNVNGIPYVDFYFPALLASTSMMVSFFESTYGNFSRLTYQSTYSTMLLSPLSVSEIVLGEVLWGATKGTLSAFGIVLVGLPLGLVDSVIIFPVLAVVFISSFLFSSLGMLITSIVKNYDAIIYPTSGLIVPMSLICGTYFSIERFPFVIKYLIYVLPLTHTVVVARGLFNRGFEWIYIVNILFLIVVAILLVRKAIAQIKTRLIS